MLLDGVEVNHAVLDFLRSDAGSACPELQDADGLLFQRLSGGWRPDVLWTELRLFGPTRSRLCPSNTQGRQAFGLADSTADQIRPGDQPEDCKGVRPRSPHNAAHGRRRGD